MERRNYLAGTALGAVTSATALLGGCLDSLETDGTGSGEDTDTDGTDTSDVDDSADNEGNEASDDDDTDSANGEDQDADDLEQDDDDDSAQDGDESRDQDDESEHQEEDEGEQAGDGNDEGEQADDGNDENEQTDEGDESTGDGNVEFEVIDMTPSMESGTEFTYIVLAHTDGSESIPGEASLVDETGSTVDSTSYEAISGGGSFELTYQAPTVDEETEVALTIETDHGPVNLGSVRVFPSEPDENDDSGGSVENGTDGGDSSNPTENSTESDD